MNIKYKRINKAGGFTLPAELRRDLNLSSGDAVDIEKMEDGTLTIKPHSTRCFFCGSMESVKKFRGKEVCTSCIGELSQEVHND